MSDGLEAVSRGSCILHNAFADSRRGVEVIFPLEFGKPEFAHARTDKSANKVGKNGGGFDFDDHFFGRFVDAVKIETGAFVLTGFRTHEDIDVGTELEGLHCNILCADGVPAVDSYHVANGNLCPNGTVRT